MKGNRPRDVHMKTERSESATTRWLADSTLVTLMPKKLKNPMEIMRRMCYKS